MQIAKFFPCFVFAHCIFLFCRLQNSAMPSDLTIQLTIRPTDSLPAEVLAEICRKAHRAGMSPAEYIAGILRRAVKSSPRRTARTR